MVVKWFPEAEDDLRGIYIYYKGAAGEKIAREIVNRIKAKADSLVNVPSRGLIEPLLADIPGEHRYVVVKRLHKIIYRVKGESVYISYVFDCRQDPANLRAKAKSSIRTRTNS
jgi:plasmid stabilization system protein ParE